MNYPFPILEEDVKKFYNKTIMGCLALLKALRSGASNVSPFLQTAQTVTEDLHKAILNAQQNVLILSGILTLLEDNVEGEMKEMTETLERISRVTVLNKQNVASIKRLHQIYLIDLIEKRDEINLLMDTKKAKAPSTKKDRHNVLVHSRSTYHDTILELIPLFENYLSGDVIMITAYFDYYKDGIRKRTSGVEVTNEKVLDTLLDMSNQNRIGEFSISVYRKDSTNNCDFTLKHSEDGKINLRVKRMYVEIAADLITEAVHFFQTNTGIEKINRNKRGAIRTYLKSILNLRSHVSWRADLQSGLDDFVLPLYYTVCKGTSYTLPHGVTGFNDPVLMIQLLRQEFGTLTVTNGELSMVEV